jgi:hypothetical protein
MWQKVKNMRIPGSIVAASLTGVLLGVTMVLFTRSPVASPIVPTLEESTSGKNESLEVVLILASGEELLVKVTGESTMVVVQSLKRILNSMDGSLLLEKSSPYTLPLEKSTMKRLANSSSIMS